MPSERDWLRLVHARGLGAASVRALLERFPDIEAIAAAGVADLRAAGLKDDLAERLAAPDERAIERDLAWLEPPRRHLIGLDDPRYPALLGAIDNAPLALYVAGDPGALAGPQLAVVGSRNPTASGRETAAAFAHDLAGRGFGIVSGMATGIDAAAHRGALEAGGATVAVCGTGLDHVYPARHRDLAERIVRHGALVSEFSTDTRARAANFPRRNRIISGLAIGTLVVEAARRSGSLITAHLATEQGREVFAVPGSIHNPLARGCHRLIREGAKLVESSADILSELSALAALHDNESPPPEETRVAEAPQEDDDDYRRLLDALGHDPAPVDTLIERSGLTADAVSSMLLILELQGRVSTVPGGRYQRVAEGEIKR